MRHQVPRLGQPWRAPAAGASAAVASAPARPRGVRIQEDPERVRCGLAGVCGAPCRRPAARAAGDRGVGGVTRGGAGGYLSGEDPASPGELPVEKQGLPPEREPLMSPENDDPPPPGIRI